MSVKTKLIHDSKLIKLLQSLSKEEFKQLGNYMNSPFFLKKGKEVLTLYCWLKKHYPSFSSKAISKERIFKKVYPNTTYSDGKMRNLLLDFVKIIESYLLHIETETDIFEKKKRLTNIYSKRNIHCEFIKSTKQLRAQLEKHPYQDANYFKSQYQIERDYYFNPETQKIQENVKSLQKSLSSFEKYFVLERIKLGIDLKNREKIFKEKHDFEFDDFSQILPKDNLIYRLYTGAFELLRTGNEQLFFELSILYKENIDKINWENQAILLQILQNFASQNLRKNEKLFAHSALDFYKLGLEKEIIIVNGKLSAQHYLNIAKVMSKYGDYSLSLSFVEKYCSFLQDSMRNHLKLTAKAIIEFNNENYLSAIEYLNAAKTLKNHNIHTLNTLSLRTFFKLFQENNTYYDLFLSTANSFERALYRDKILSKSKLENALSFVQILKKIGNDIDQNNLTKQKINKYLQTISDQALIYNSWLVEILKKLENAPENSKAIID